MNMNFIMKTALIVIFVAYSMTVPELRIFMLESTAGRFILTMTIVAICLSLPGVRHCKPILEVLEGIINGNTLQTVCFGSNNLSCFHFNIPSF